MAAKSPTGATPAAPHIFGIRHHGPGSARSLKRALEELNPDCLLIEGPPDADDLFPLLVHKETKPPVAILIHAADNPRQAVYYPFATFSPEYQAIAYALRHKTPVRFMDLPQSHQMAMEPRPAAPVPTATPAPGDAPPPPEPPATPTPAATESPTPPLRRDPLGALAEAAGFSDGERWWEHMVEHRRDGAQLFAAILEAMTAVRADADIPDDPRDLLREAWMRTTIRAAQEEGFERIAVVCGAWHAPVLAAMPPEKDDASLLKTLPKPPAKVQSTLVPWTYDRLTYLSGYGAGVQSPGWYDHLWHHPDQTIVRWMTRVAHLFRDEDLDCSSAHVIESVRLADTLASLRGRPLPGLPELNDAARAVFCHDTDLPMRLIAERLIVGHRLGEVPESTPAVPLQQDLARHQKRLRLKPEAAERKLDLDLRNETDLDRSRLLHRLALLKIPWGRPDPGSRGGGKGTFHELWLLRWEPELAISLIEAGVWGSTIEDAAAAFARDAADKAPDLPAVSALLDATLLADLPAAAPHVMQRLENLAAVAADTGHLMDALPPLAGILRYGNVRQTDAAMVSRAVSGLVARITVGLPAACASLNDAAASQMYTRLLSVHSALSTLQNPDHLASWYAALRQLSTQQSLHGLVAGRSTRLLLDASQLPPDDAARLLSLALSPANDPAHSAAWLEGFLKGSGLILLHDDHLWQLIDQWVTQLPDDTFTQTLPLIRRTFSTFPPPERRQMGDRAKQGKSASSPSPVTPTGDLDHERAQQVLPLLNQLLGLSPNAPRHSERSEESQLSDHQHPPFSQGTEPDSASPGGSRSDPNSSSNRKAETRNPQSNKAKS